MEMMLRGEDSPSLARERRAGTNVGIIMLTAKGDTTDRIAGLEQGADDYIARPFEERELLARIPNVLRRAGRTGGAPAPAGSGGGNVVRFAGWRPDLDACELTAGDGRTADLTSSEFNLLAEFVDRPGRVRTRDDRLNAVQNRGRDACHRSIDVLITRLRRKIEPDPRRPLLIGTVRGAGYILAVNVEAVAVAKT